jgi:hypothetical protein
MSEQSPLEPLARIGSADDTAGSETTSFGVEGTDDGVQYPTEVAQPGTFLGELDDYLYSVSEEEGV